MPLVPQITRLLLQEKPPRQTEPDAFPAAPVDPPKAAGEEKAGRRKSRSKPDVDQPPPPKPPAPAPAPAPSHAEAAALRSELPARPQTARRAPPKIKSNEVVAEREAQRPPSGKPKAEPVGGGSQFDNANAPNVIGEGDASDDDGA